MCVYARTRRFSRPSFYISKHVFFSPSLLLLNSPTLHPTISPHSDAFSSFFYFPQNDRSFFKNDKSLFTKRRVTFHKTTGRFSQNNGSFFLQNKTHAALLQNLRTFVAWTNQFIVSNKFSKKRHFYFVGKNIISIFAPHIHILKHFSYGC